MSVQSVPDNLPFINDTLEDAAPLSNHPPAAGRPGARRALSLDAVRGLAILGMVLSGMVPYFKDTLPPWMYHAQVPPPDHIYNAALSGLTWVDVVFPLFLFSLGAAIPLALGPKLERGERRLPLLWSALSRGALLLFFALYVKHLAPGLLQDSYGFAAWPMGLLAFALLFLIFTRMPSRWPAVLRWSLRIAGYIGAAAMLATVRYADGSGFTVHRHDIILAILANVVVGTTAVWLAFRGRTSAMLCVMGLVSAILLASQFHPPVDALLSLEILRPRLGDWLVNGIAWACRPAYQQYLLVSLPGVIAGSLLAPWLRPASHKLSASIQNSRWRELSTVRSVCIGIVCLALVTGVIGGLSLHDNPTTSAVALALAAMGLVLLYGPPTRRPVRPGRGLRGHPRVNAIVFRHIFTWGIAWLALGLALLPYQGGIKKDPATFSYLFVCTGLAHMVLILMAVITDALHRPGLVRLLIANGQNPMIAYVAGGMVILPLLHMIPASAGLSLLDWINAHTPGPWPAFARGLGYTLLTAFLVTLFTRLKLFWRT